MLKDVASLAVAVAARDNRKSPTTIAFLVDCWQRLGRPTILQVDNALEFRGSNRYPRSFGRVIRLCLESCHRNHVHEPLDYQTSEQFRQQHADHIQGYKELWSNIQISYRERPRSQTGRGRPGYKEFWQRCNRKNRQIYSALRQFFLEIAQATSRQFCHNLLSWCM